MPTVIPVKFKYAARDLWFDPGMTGAQEGDHVICSTERGTEIGLATMDAIEMDVEQLRSTIGNATLKPVLRVVSDEDLDRAEELADRADQDFPTFRRLVSESGLDMKPVGVEYLFDGSKAVCYFSAEERVDFRQLVRDLARELHIRIDMRQIGVREEAAIIGGYAHCGQELCCARFGRQFEPVSIRMAKEQDLPLNSTKISGACGRLMCCLRYEFEAYRDFKSRAPKRNAVIETPLGKGKIVEYDTPKEQICLRLENGKQVRVALADMEASEAAVKKSQELNCPCRPDTVTRAALDKLESPEIKMALAELDRKNGVVPEDTFDAKDIFVETKPRRRRRSSGADAHAEQQDASQRKGRGAHAARDEAGSDAGASASGQGKTRRRRRRAKAGTAAGQQGTSPAQAPQGEEQRQQAGTTRRRRRHHGGAPATEGASTAPAKAQGPEEKPAQRSRQKQGDAAQGKGQAQEQRQDGQTRPRRRRRPGDRGGVAAQERAAQQGPQAGQGGSGQGSAPSQGGEAQATGEQKSRRRRRRRGGRGRGGKGAAGGEAPKAE